MNNNNKSYGEELKQWWIALYLCRFEVVSSNRSSKAKDLLFNTHDELSTK
jgi:hypothetical protein